MALQLDSYRAAALNLGHPLLKAVCVSLFADCTRRDEAQVVEPRNKTPGKGWKKPRRACSLRRIEKVRF